MRLQISLLEVSDAPDGSFAPKNLPSSTAMLVTTKRAVMLAGWPLLGDTSCAKILSVVATA